MRQYQELLDDVLTLGHLRNTRSGPVFSVFDRRLEFYMAEGFPAVTTKKLQFESVAAELAGFLQAERRASKMGSSIWEADARRWYNTPGSNSMGPDDLGEVYGVQWREAWNWRDEEPVDQLQAVVDLLKTDPHSRRLFVSAWIPGELDYMCLPPCHTHFQFYVNKDSHLDLKFYMRSVDCFLGLPFNIAGYGLLLHIIAAQTSFRPGRLVADLGDCHIYSNHVRQVDELLSREPLPLPILRMNPDTTIDNFTPESVHLVRYKHHPAIKAPLNVGE